MIKATYGDNRSGTIRVDEAIERTTRLTHGPERPPEPEPEFYQPAPDGEFHVYVLDDGATYWIGARSVGEAFAAYVALDPEAAEDQCTWQSIAIERLVGDRAARVKITDDGCDENPRSAAVIAASLTSPQVIGCSEWP